MQLKNYQQRSLDVLGKYFQNCKKFGDAADAFYFTTKEVEGGSGRTYIQVEELPGLPYVCLRVPTGGGKTLMAAHSVSLAARDFLGLDHSFVLWLTPSTTIREQTLNALKDRRHPYRSALESTLGNITILELGEALYVQPATLASDTVILVSTTQAFRVGDPELRKVYEASGSLMSHFDNVPASAEVDRYENDKPIPSLANLLRLHRPVIIVDEAQNVRSPLSFETLARFNPSCILEFTATPHREDHPSNVLYSISARELKAESMIKLPLRLETRSGWKELMGDAILKLKELEGLAEAERAQTGEYLRPIMLLQAQPLRAGRQTVSVEVVEACLREDYNIPAEQIARATGKDDDIADVNLTAPDCKIRYIITVQKLREGWDCSFAYVLCSVAEQSSATAVEQIVGRILRMPKATRKLTPDLNMAYAYVASSNFIETLNTLTDALVENGFQKQEAKDLVVEPQQKGFGPLFDYQATSSQVLAFKISEPSVLEKLPEDLAGRLRYDTSSQTLEVPTDITVEEIQAIKPAFKGKQAQNEFAQRVAEAQARVIALGLTPSERGEPFSIPVLACRQNGFLAQLEETHFLGFDWELPKQNAILTELEFTADRPAPQQGEIDVTDKGKVESQFIKNLKDQLALLKVDLGWDTSNLVHWLDRNFSHPDLTATETGIYLTVLVNNLIEKRGIPLQTLVREKYRLRDAIARKVEEYRQSAHGQAFKSFFDATSKIEVTPDKVFSFGAPEDYPAPVGSLYRGEHTFKKHYYPEVGKFDSNEEKLCAEYIETLDEVEVWVRNISNQPTRSFWFQTSSDRFYPDFVCKLKDGRYLVVEYKGKDRYDNPEEKEKREIGALWEKRSNSQCLFIMPTDRKYDVIRAKVKQQS
ncbi:MAG: DEAD/DEAH box helicase family protein [Chloroflexi bacterium]|nr:DEAD/DEAH box helicase family protein [Chloroflexota bacterium]